MYLFILICWLESVKSHPVLGNKEDWQACVQYRYCKVIQFFRVASFPSKHECFPSLDLLFFFFFFSWSVLALQFCVSLCCESAIYIHISRASQVAQWINNPPAMQEMQETWVQSLGWHDPLEEGVATHPSILAWRIPRTEAPGGLQSIVS